jgi:hypothetical protein
MRNAVSRNARHTDAITDHRADESLAYSARLEGVAAQQRADDEPHDGRDDEIRSEDKRQQNSQSKLAQLTNQRQANLIP